jgi:hypothetical protein
VRLLSIEFPLITEYNGDASFAPEREMRGIDIIVVHDGAMKLERKPVRLSISVPTGVATQIRSILQRFVMV